MRCEGGMRHTDTYTQKDIDRVWPLLNSVSLDSPQTPQTPSRWECVVATTSGSVIYWLRNYYGRCSCDHFIIRQHVWGSGCNLGDTTDTDSRSVRTCPLLENNSA
ncbi:hypothetical protein RRG08_003910 [Elysia crispata]|uniref:Uncharacterized protein n=1 Tax=Elysia crispata TaxID=231223 RepID=A0AAE0YV29_9GAST|nr:hypothetical protein RRG08_003910 [Elysia crispata]